MKKRIGLVSNSSSTSFVLCSEEDRDIAHNYLIKWTEATDLIKIYEEAQKKMLELSSILDELPYFLRENIYLQTMEVDSRLSELQELEEKFPGCCISEPCDRDVAYEHGWDFHEYEVDL